MPDDPYGHQAIGVTGDISTDDGDTVLYRERDVDCPRVCSDVRLLRRKAVVRRYEQRCRALFSHHSRRLGVVRVVADHDAKCQSVNLEHGHPVTGGIDRPIDRGVSALRVQADDRSPVKDRGGVVQPSCPGHFGKAHDGRDRIARERGKRANELITVRVNRKFVGIGGIVRQAAQNRLWATEDGHAVRFTPCHSPAYQVDCLDASRREVEEPGRRQPSRSNIRDGQWGLDVQDVFGKGSDTSERIGAYPSRLVRPLFVVAADVRALN